MMASIDFRSDNTGRAGPQVIAAIAAANEGTALGYGSDEMTAALQGRFEQLFETPLQVYPVATGTAANAIALAAACKPFGAIYCSEDAHINTAECNATGFFSGGAKLVAVAGSHGKLSAEPLEEAIKAAGVGLAHRSQPAAINLVQASDLGAVYSTDEIRILSTLAHNHGLTVHMDGARFANAIARLGCSPADGSWRSGVDVLSFGVTKNGGLLADAIVVFRPEIAHDIGFHLRRAGLVWSKMRFASAQLMAAVQDGLWLQLAAQANAAATDLASRIDAIDDVTLLAPVDANLLFVKADPAVLNRLAQSGVLFYRRSECVARLVCRWDTGDAEIAAMAERLASCAEMAG